MSGFPTKLKKLRTDYGLTQTQLAKSLHVSQNAVYNWENGKREPNLDMMKKIAKTFEIALYLLLDDDYQLPDIDLNSQAWKNRARFLGDTEMIKPPGPVTVPRFATLENTTHDTINTNEQQARFEWINERLNCGKEITEDDEKFRWEYMEQALRKIYADTARRILNAYNQLNQEGQLRAAEQVEMLTEIPKYRRKPNDQ